MGSSNSRLDDLEKKYKDTVKKENELRQEIDKQKQEIEKLKEEQKVVAASRPWRNFEKNGGWNRFYGMELRNQIETRKSKHDIQFPRVLLLGRSQAGKSSFINSAMTVNNNEQACAVVAEPSTRNVTRKLAHVYLNVLKLLLLDTRGLADVQGFLDEDIDYLIKGHIKHGYEFDTNTKISEKNTEYFKRNPSLEDRIHCVVFVAEAQHVENGSFPDEFLRRIHILKENLHSQNINTVLLLTKVDKVHPEIDNDLTLVHHNKDMKAIVKKAETYFEIQEMNIFPVRNYSTEMEMDENMNILLLLALRRIAFLADGHIAAYENQMKHAQNTV